MIFTDALAEFAIEMLVDGLELTDDHDYLDKEVGPKFSEVADVLLVDFGPVEVRGVEQMHGVLADELDEEDAAVWLFEVGEFVVGVEFFG